MIDLKGQNASLYKISHRFVQRLLSYGDLSVFRNGGRPPSWICYVHVWTTHNEHSVVFITVQNFVGIDAVVSITWKC